MLSRVLVPNEWEPLSGEPDLVPDAYDPDLHTAVERALEHGLLERIAPGSTIVFTRRSALVDDNYERAIRAGATGGKILGAGGGGFLLFYVEPEYQQAVIGELAPLQLIRSRFDTGGSRITYYEPSRFS